MLSTIDKIVSLPKNLISFILEPKFEGAFLYIKNIFIGFSIFFGIGIIVLLFVNSWLRRFILEDLVEAFVTRPYGAKKAFKEWVKIQKRFETGREDEYKLAVIEADGLLDDVLQKIGYKGETMGERLKQIDSAILPNIDDVLQAHRVRNHVIHDPDYRLTLETAKRAIGIYEKALRSLEAF